MSEALSSSHERVHRLRRLVQKRSLRWSEGVAVLEGPDLVEAALDTEQDFEAVFTAVDAEIDARSASIVERVAAKGVGVFALAPGVLERVTDAKTPQPVLAVVRMPVAEPSSLALDGLVLVLHEVRDPGNAGTAIRSAEALGADAVVFTGSSVDPFNPKTLRATAGAIFYVPVILAELAPVVATLRGSGKMVWAAVVRGGVELATADLGGPAAVVFGGEAEGLDSEAIDLCDARLSIRMVGHAESLNLGVAASLVSFEALRQRQGATQQPPRPSLGGS